MTRVKTATNASVKAKLVTNKLRASDKSLAAKNKKANKSSPLKVISNKMGKCKTTVSPKKGHKIGNKPVKKQKAVAKTAVNVPDLSDSEESDAGISGHNDKHLSLSDRDLATIVTMISDKMADSSGNGPRNETNFNCPDLNSNSDGSRGGQGPPADRLVDSNATGNNNGSFRAISAHEKLKL